LPLTWIPWIVSTMLRNASNLAARSAPSRAAATLPSFKFAAADPVARTTFLLQLISPWPTFCTTESSAAAAGSFASAAWAAEATSIASIIRLSIHFSYGTGLHSDDTLTPEAHRPLVLALTRTISHGRLETAFDGA